MDFEEARAAAAWRRAAVLVAGENFAARAGRYRGRITAAMVADRGVTVHSLAVGTTQFALAGVGLDGHTASRGIFMDVDLHRRT